VLVARSLLYKHLSKTVQQEVKMNWALSNAFKGCDHPSRKTQHITAIVSERENERERERERERDE
jgi:hypothetical protein